MLGAEPRRIAEIPALLAEARETQEIPLWDGHAGERAADVLVEFVAGARTGGRLTCAASPAR